MRATSGQRRHFEDICIPEGLYSIKFNASFLLKYLLNNSGVWNYECMFIIRVRVRVRVRACHDTTDMVPRSYLIVR